MNPPLFQIDYGNHPGYRGLLVRPIVDVPECDTLFATIDGRYREYIGRRKPTSSKETVEFAKEKIFPLIQELKKIVRHSMKDGDLFLPSTCVALDNLYQTLLSEMRFRNAQHKYTPRPSAPNVERVVTDLGSHGISLHRIPKDKIQLIWDSLAIHRKELEQRKLSRPKGMASCVKSLPLRGEYWKVFGAELRRLGVIDAVQKFSRHKMDLDYCALHLAHEYEDWYQNCYSDVGLSTQRATYMHFDQDYALIKAMVYLKDFDESLGPLAPFSLTKSEHLRHWSYSKSAFFKELDIANEAVIAGDPEFNTSYYRKIFKFPKLRAEFLKIPRQLQGSSHFGDDLLDESDLSKYLIAHETKLTSEVGNCAVFTGGHNVHRGGMVSNGERWAFQVGFRMRDHSYKGLTKRWRKTAGLYSPALAKKIFRTLKPLKR